MWAGRAFLRRLFDFLKILLRKDRHKRFRIPGEALKDLKWWLAHAKNFNGNVPIPNRNAVNALHVHTDACLSGGAGIWKREWFYQNLAEYDERIAPKEFRMVLLAVET